MLDFGMIFLIATHGWLNGKILKNELFASFDLFVLCTVIATSRPRRTSAPLRRTSAPLLLPRRPLGRWVVVGRPSEDEDVPLGMTNEVKEHASDADPVREGGHGAAEKR